MESGTNAVQIIVAEMSLAYFLGAKRRYFGEIAAENGCLKRKIDDYGMQQYGRDCPGRDGR